MRPPDEDDADPTLRAFRDAVRDIMAAEGRFEVQLGDDLDELQGWNGAIQPSPSMSTLEIDCASGSTRLSAE